MLKRIVSMMISVVMVFSYFAPAVYAVEGAPIIVTQETIEDTENTSEESASDVLQTGQEQTESEDVSSETQITTETTKVDESAEESSLNEVADIQLVIDEHGTKITSGSCGDNAVYAVYDTDSDGTGDRLVISGSGTMTSSLWAEYASDIRTVVIEEGITSVGPMAFKDFGSLTDITMPAGITVISDARPTVTVKIGTTGKPVISWNKVEGAVKYQIYRSTAQNGTYTLINTVAGTSTTNKNAVKGKKYFYKVVAVHSNTNANSAYSTVVSITSK
ncbi:MAG: hypothetical protein IKA10_07670 [Oscillospiraceae bacterium]|nr:hypothetical protein [Oscillospiraceae bacterium]